MKANFSKLAFIISMVAAMAVSFTSCDKNGDSSNSPINPQSDTQRDDTYDNMSEGRYIFVNNELLQYVNVTATYKTKTGNYTSVMSSDTYTTPKCKAAMCKAAQNIFTLTDISAMKFLPSVFEDEAQAKTVNIEVKPRPGVVLPEKLKIYYEVLKVEKETYASSDGTGRKCTGCKGTVYRKCSYSRITNLDSFAQNTMTDFFNTYIKR